MVSITSHNEAYIMELYICVCVCVFLRLHGIQLTIKRFQ